MNNDKTKSIIGYIVFICALIFLFQKDSSKEVKLHCAQSIVIAVGYLILSFVIGFMVGILSGITGLGIFGIFSYIPHVLYIACIVIGIVKANGDGDQEIPVVGGIAKSIFAKQIEG